MSWLINYCRIILLAMYKLGYTDSDLALRSGISASQLASMRRGRLSSVSTEMIRKLDMLAEELLKEGK